MREIRLAESAGFCFGVQRSVEMAERLMAEQGSCCSLGELIHNEDVVERLKAQGLRVIASPEEAAEGEHVIIRAHGVAEGVYDRLAQRGAVVTDASCPKVKAIHTIVSRASAEGRFVIIIGMRKHPEVEGICGWCGEHAVFENPQELARWLDENESYWTKAITVVVQTTQTRSNFNECCDIIKKRCTNTKISDTICSATFTRQEEAAKLAAECDAMVVIGGKHSANSVHLAQICAENCANVQFIERLDELDTGALRSADTVGLTAGASTPAWIIKEVRNKMSDEIKVEETKLENEKSFDEMLEETLKTIYNGDKVTGTVVAITGTEISVDLGTKYSGFIPTTEFTVVTEENKGGVVVNVKGVRVFVPASQTDLPREADLAQLLKKTVRLKITEVNKARKRVVGSIRRVAQAERRERTEAIWNEIEIGKKYSGVVKSLTSYGAFVDIGGIDGMVHVSELSWGRIHQPSEVLSVGDEVEVYVINFDKEKRKISLGYKDPEANPWVVFTNKYSVGDVAQVKVVKLMPFGAFAEVVDGVDGLIHISQIANRRIGKPEDVLTVGDVVEAKITAIDEDKHKISLSIRALSEPAPAAAKVEEEEYGDEPAEDALVYEVSESGEATGIAPEADPTDAE